MARAATGRAYRPRSPGIQLGGADNASWTTFSFSGGPVTIEVRRLMGAAPQKVVVRPLRRTITAAIGGNGAKFQILAPAKISVEFDDDLLNKLFIFADTPEVNPPKQGDANVLYFGPGVHDLGAGYSVGSGCACVGGSVARPWGGTHEIEFSWGACRYSPQ